VVMKGMDDMKFQGHTTTTDELLQDMEDVLFRTPQVESKTAAQDGTAAGMDAEVTKDTTDATPQVETSTAAQDETAAVEAEVTKGTAEARPQVETAAQDEVEVLPMMDVDSAPNTTTITPLRETEAEMQARLTSKSNKEMEERAATEDAADAKPQIEAATTVKNHGKDEAAATETAVTKGMDDTELQAHTTTTDELLQDMEDTLFRTPQVESRTVAQRRTAAEMEAEVMKDMDEDMAKDMANAKPQVERKTATQDEDDTAAEMEALVTAVVGPAGGP